MIWNYRIGTYIYHHNGNNNQGHNMDGIRLFKIIDVYYEDDKEVSYGDRGYWDKTDGYESFNDLKISMELMKMAFNKPIIDLDNWPNEWINKE